MTIRKYYMDSHWGQLHYRAIHTSNDTHIPLLMLHPTPKSGWIWEPLMPVLGSSRTVIAPDTPGYGASDAPEHPATIEEFAEVMLKLMEDLAKDGNTPAGPFDITGYHTGSVIAVAMANAAPDRVRRIAPVSLPLYTAEQREKRLKVLSSGPVAMEDGSHLIKMWQICKPSSTLGLIRLGNRNP